MLAVTLAAALALASSVVAQPSPLTPASAKEGDNCIISWTPDQTGKWTDTNIELMTGDNLNMVHLTTVTTVSTTSAAPTTYTWTCPDVTLNSVVYFYQFSHVEEPNNLLWTTRWAIAGADGTTVPAPFNETTSDGNVIGWGTGALVNTALIKPAPAYIHGQTSQLAGGGGAVASGSAVASSPSASVMPSSRASASRVVGSASVAKASASSSASSSANAAGRSTSQNSLFVVALGAVAAGFMALA